MIVSTVWNLYFQFQNAQTSNGPLNAGLIDPHSCAKGIIITASFLSHLNKLHLDVFIPVSSGPHLNSLGSFLKISPGIRLHSQIG